jgi:thiol-disulfide isomerase/thioredoxin
MLKHLVGAPSLRREHIEVEDLTYRTLEGQVIHASSLKGKVAFVNVWGTWCPPCVMEMPAVQKLYAQYRHDSNIVFVIAASRDTPQAVRIYARNHQIDVPFYITLAGDIPASLHVKDFPTTLIYAKDGSLAAEHVGRADWSAPSVVAFLRELEQEKYPAVRTKQSE